MAAKANIVIDQGTDFSTTISVTDANGSIMNLDGYTGASKIRKHYTSTNAVAFTVGVDANTGEVTLSLTSTQTDDLLAGRYVYDVELYNAESNTTSRIIEGLVTLTPSVTK